MRLRDRFNRKTRQPSTRTQRIGFAFFWLIVLAYGFFVASDANWNTESHLYPAFAAVDHHTLQLDAYQQRLGDKSYWHGHYYSDKAPGLSLLAIPIYAGLRLVMPSQVGKPYEVYPHMQYAIPRSTVYLRYAITYVLIILPSALFTVLFWLFLSRFASQGWSLLLAGTYALGTIAYPFSVRFYSHQLTAILLFGAFMVLYVRVRGRPGGRAQLGWTALAGGLAGYAVISEYPCALIAGALLIYGLWVARQRARTALAFLAGTAPAVALGATYNTLAFGGPFSTGYMYTHSSLYHNNARAGVLGIAGLSSYGLQWPTLHSLWEITFGAYRGLFLLSPVLLLFAAGLRFMWRRRELRAELWLCLGVVVGYFLLDASHGAIVNGWSGGTSVASRHLVPALPFMCLPMVFGLRDRAFRVAFAVLGSISVLAMFATVAGVGLFSMTDMNPIVNELLPQFVSGHIQPNWGNMAGLTGFPSLSVLVVVASLLLARLLWLFRGEHGMASTPELTLSRADAS